MSSSPSSPCPAESGRYPKKSSASSPFPSSSSSSAAAPPDMAAVSFGSSSGDASDDCPRSPGVGVGGSRRRPRTSSTGARGGGGGSTPTPASPAGATTTAVGATRPKAARRSLARAMMELASAPSSATLGSVGSSSAGDASTAGGGGSTSAASSSGGLSGSSMRSRLGMDAAASAAFSPLRACVSQTGCIVGGGAASAADCNDEVSSPSFLVLDGMESSYLGRGGAGSTRTSPTASGGGESSVASESLQSNEAGEKARASGVGVLGWNRRSSSVSIGSSCPWDRSRGEGMIREAVERWAARADARICVGSVSYDYRQEEERNSGRGGGDSRELSFLMGTSVSQTLTRTPLPVESQSLFPMGTIVSQTLTRTPLPRLQDHCSKGSAGGGAGCGGKDGVSNRTVYTDGYLLPIHSMAADNLMHGEFDEALELLEKIRDSHSRKYGADDLVVAIDTHNIGVAKLLAGHRDEALIVFHEAVLAKKDCVGETHPLVADSLVEVGILLHARGELRRALSIFNEALDCCFNGSGEDAPPPLAGRASGDINPRWRRKSKLPGGRQEHDALLVSRILCNIGCVVHDMGEDADAALWVLNEAMEVQRTALGSLSIKAESSLLNLALTQANVGYVKLRAAIRAREVAPEEKSGGNFGIDASVDAGGGCAEALAHFEEALLVLQSVFGEDSEIETIRNISDDMLLAKDMLG